jgi:hypothetical protein
LGAKALCKVIVDHTAFVQLRNPLDLGGAIWTASVVLHQGLCLLSGWLYCSGIDQAPAAPRLECSSVLGFLGVASGISAVAAGKSHLPARYGGLLVGHRAQVCADVYIPRNR